jgi:hypothetical protein
MVNRYLPHLLVLPEDDADRQLANGFLNELDLRVLRRVQVLEEAGGWIEVLNRFNSDEAPGMDRYTNGIMVLLIDFDGQKGRLNDARRRIPERFRDRIFVLGAWTNPEALRTAGLGSYETIGRAPARDCREETAQVWGHDLLRQFG